MHSSGSARTEGYYHLTDNDKMKYMQNSKLMVAEQLGVDANDDSNVEVTKIFSFYESKTCDLLLSEWIEDPCHPFVLSTPLPCNDL